MCPKVKNCGQKIYKAKADSLTEVSINPFETFMAPGDKCSYLLQVDDYEAGDVIELSGIDSVRMELTLFHGGYSLGSSTQKTQLENGKRYLLDGTQKLFLMTNTVDSGYFGKPYFSLALKKLPSGAIASDEDSIEVV